MNWEENKLVDDDEYDPSEDKICLKDFNDEANDEANDDAKDDAKRDENVNLLDQTINFESKIFGQHKEAEKETITYTFTVFFIIYNRTITL